MCTITSVQGCRFCFTSLHIVIFIVLLTFVNFILYNRTLTQKTLPCNSDWRHVRWMEESYLIPFFKNKDDIRQCGNYRATKLISHMIKIWEHVVSRRLLQLPTVTQNQYRYVAGRSATDAVHSTRIFMKKYRESLSSML